MIWLHIWRLDDTKDKTLLHITHYTISLLRIYFYNLPWDALLEFVLGGRMARKDVRVVWM